MQLKILTYNILQKPPGINDVQNEYKNQRIDLLVQETKDFDIVLFQEAFRWCNEKYYKMLEKFLTYEFQYFAQCDNPEITQKSVLDGGLVIVSKYEILKSEFQSFDNGIEIECLANNGILYAQIQVKNQKLHLFNNHTQAIYEPENVQTKNSCLIQNIKQLLIVKKFIAKILDEEYQKGDAIFLAGDFNLNANEYTYNLNPVLETFYSKQNLNLSKVKGTYDLLMFILNHNNQDIIYKDIYLDKNKKHEITFGDVIKNQQGKEIPREIVLTMKQEQMVKETLDYIFQITYKKDSNKNYEIEKIQTEKFFVENQPFTQISDHYGISLQLKILQVIF